MFNKIKSFVTKPEETFRPDYAGQFIQVFSHPRSGTHFLEAFLGKNFYPDEDLSICPVKWGHWSNREINEHGNAYGKLFGSHAYPNSEFQNINYPAIYIARDGRAVAYSIWKTQNFLNHEHNSISFSDFLRLKLDWIGSPAFRSREKYNIAEHWSRHVKGWRKISKANSNILYIWYEDLVERPFEVYDQIHRKFFIDRRKIEENYIDTISEPFGLLPNEAKIDSWKSIFSEADKEFFNKHTKSISF